MRASEEVIRFKVPVHIFSAAELCETETRNHQVRQVASFTTASCSDLNQPVENSRKRKGVAGVWPNLPRNTLRAGRDLSQWKIWVNSG